MVKSLWEIPTSQFGKGCEMSTVEERGRVVTVRDKGRITIPASWRDRYGLSEGSEVVLVAEEDRLVLYPRRVQQLEGLLERIASALEEKGITLNELLEDSAKSRAESFRKKYPGLASEHGA